MALLVVMGVHRGLRTTLPDYLPHLLGVGTPVSRRDRDRRERLPGCHRCGLAVRSLVNGDEASGSPGTFRIHPLSPLALGYSLL